MPLVSFYTIWKHQNLWFSNIFRRYKRRPVTRNGLTHSFSMHPLGFLMFLRGRERVHWERMGREQFLTSFPEISCSKKSSKISQKQNQIWFYRNHPEQCLKKTPRWVSASVYRSPKTYEISGLFQDKQKIIEELS